ncbi:MAG: deoxynucleoside kinase [Candidatus Aminicenantia bacterium]
MRFNHIGIEGPPKSGKKALVQALSKEFPAYAVFDNEYNPYLKDFYKGKEEVTLLNQLVFLINRYNQQMDLLQRKLFQETVICDYIFEKDKIYAYQTLSDSELHIYNKLFDILYPKIPKPDIVVYLQLSDEVLLKRIRKRGIQWERNVSEEYFKGLNEAFNYFFFHYTLSPILIINCDELDFESDSWDLASIKEKILETRAGTNIYVPKK